MKLSFLLPLGTLLICAMSLYIIKTDVDSRHDELVRLKRAVSSEQNEAAILRAEWSFLTRPERLLDLSQNLLSMTPIPQERIVSIDEIPLRITDSGQTASSKKNAGKTITGQMIIENTPSNHMAGAR